MAVIFAERALLHDGWAERVRLHCDAERITRIERNVEPVASDERQSIAIPAMINLHSHAFQFGMAGLTEQRGATSDSFWSWRDLMYRFALTMTPDEMRVIAEMAYIEMVEAGYGRVTEFHYLHHDRDGRAYSDIGEMAASICAAAVTAGIGLTMLPVFYAHAGFGGQMPHDGQRRFINDLGSYERLLARCRDLVSPLPDASLGIAPHSLRAVTPEELAEVATLAPGVPIHIHIAEQMREVEDCIAWSGLRPVEWLYRHARPDARWCLIHATHMTKAEIAMVAASGAVAGLCPVTEANLGDGIFAGVEFKDHGGVYGIGTDSNVCISVAGELRQLEYSQRLATRARNVMSIDGGSTGRRLFESALFGGARAAGCENPSLREGGLADIVTLDTASPAFVARKGDQSLDSWIFAAGSCIDGVWRRGTKLVANGRHHARAEVAPRYERAIRRLLAA